MDWLCQFQAVSQTEGRLQTQQTLFFKKQTPDDTQLVQIDQQEYQVMAVQLEEQHLERSKQEQMASQMIVGADVGNLPLYLTEIEVQELKRDVSAQQLPPRIPPLAIVEEENNSEKPRNRSQKRSDVRVRKSVRHSSSANSSNLLPTFPTKRRQLAPLSKPPNTASR